MRWLVVPLFCLFATTAFAAPPNDVVHGHLVDQTDIVTAVQRAYVRRDFDALSAMARDFRTSRARTANGGWKLRWFHYGLSRAQHGYGEHRCPDESVRFAQAWMEAHPEEPAAYVMSGDALKNLGWCFRGDGGIAEVAPYGMQQFQQNLAAARKVLEDNKAVASADPHYYAVLATMAKADGTSTVDLMKLLEEATAREPYYHQTYIDAAGFFMTNWRGQPGDVRRITQYALAKTRDEDAAIYARIFWNYYGCNCFHRSDLDWNVLKRGMLDLVKQYPDDWTAAHFARIACREGDNRAASAFMARMKAPDTGVAWARRDEWQACRLAVQSERENMELRKSLGR
jgi:hypothetical protein